MTNTTKINPILMDLPLPIITPRLVIRPVMTGDGAAINEAKAETWDMLEKWMPWAKAMSTIDEDEEFARRAYAKFLLREDFIMVACERDTLRPVLFTGIHRFDWEIRRMEIGYWCRKSAQGKGLATESSNALIRYAFNVLNARTVAICHAEENDNSRRVIEKLGFMPEGRQVNASLSSNGTLRDHLWYSMTDMKSLPALDVKWGAP